MLLLLNYYKEFFCTPKKSNSSIAGSPAVLFLLSSPAPPHTYFGQFLEISGILIEYWMLGMKNYGILGGDVFLSREDSIYS